jgi:hypothetical protein
VPTYNKDRVTLLIRHLQSSGNLLLLRAREPAEGRCIATGIFVGMNRSAYFWGNASWRADQHFCPNEALQWYAMRYWKNRGMAEYNLCGDREYKKKYGGEMVEGYRLRKSKSHFISWSRDMAKRGFQLYQHMAGFWHGDNSGFIDKIKKPR